MTDIQTRIRDSFDRQTMLRTLGAQLAQIQPGQVVITAPILPTSLQQQGAGHAGLAFSIGDSAAGYSALSLMPEDVEVMTVEMKINLLAPGRGARLVAEGRVLKPGRRLVIVTADIWAEAEDGARSHAAHMLGTMIPVAP